MLKSYLIWMQRDLYRGEEEVMGVFRFVNIITHCLNLNVLLMYFAKGINERKRQPKLLYNMGYGWQMDCTGQKR